jgi:nanoRNase/pAp phosphatase (c-di-AMP/oligoRNAs hydrolase)
MRDLNLIRKLHGSLAAHVPGKKAQILTHWGGDADAVGSSYVLKRLLENIYTASDVGFIVPEDPSSHTAVIMRLLGLSEKLVADPDLYILVDVGSMNQLGSYRETVVESGKPVISIDHHLPRDAAETTLSIASTKYQATAEILYDLVDYLELDLSEGFAEALFLGMYYDTVRLSVYVRKKLGLTVLIVEHRVDLAAARATRVVLLSGGRVVYDGGLRNFFSEYEPHVYGVSVPRVVQLSMKVGKLVESWNTLCLSPEEFEREVRRRVRGF